jgi:MFS family permease
MTFNAPVPVTMAMHTGPAEGKTIPLEAPNEAMKLDGEVVGEKPIANDESDIESDTAEKQYGVEKIRAITSAWSYKALVCTYCLIYITSFCHAMQQQMEGNLGAYVTSEFSRHGLTATTGIVSGLMYGVSQLPLARILNIFGRMEGYVFCHMCCSFGLLLMAVCQNVETFAAAQVFWTIGSGGVGYIHTVLISDTTSLRNRMIIYTLNSTAYIGSSFAGPIVAELFQKHSTFRWLLEPLPSSFHALVLRYALYYGTTSVKPKRWERSCRHRSAIATGSNPSCTT